MSLKVYDGMRAKGPEAGFVAMNAVYSRMVALQSDLFARAVCWSVAELLDQKAAGLYSGDVPGWYEAYRLMVGRMQAVYGTSQRDPGADYGFEAFMVVHEGWTLAWFHYEHPALKELWDELSGFEPWPAWDNADAPDDVTEEEWAHRVSFWSSALDKRPLTASFTQVNILGFNPKYLPDPTRRALNLAKSLYNERNAVMREGMTASEGVREVLRVGWEWQGLDEAVRDGFVSEALAMLPDLEGFLSRR